MAKVIFFLAVVLMSTVMIFAEKNEEAVETIGNMDAVETVGHRCQNYGQFCRWERDCCFGMRCHFFTKRCTSTLTLEDQENDEAIDSPRCSNYGGFCQRQFDCCGRLRCNMRSRRCENY